MTEQEILEKRESFKKNELFQKSCSIFKDFQYEQFEIDGVFLNGQNSKIIEINGVDTVVLFNFKNGYIHSEDDRPAIEYPMHWEYWKDGLIEKIVDRGGTIREYWENGVPVRIENNTES
ncbi:MAG: hypothetical protein ACTTHG_00685 [Treponemataceae bacterium]